MYFQNQILSKTWLNHSLESTVSESPSTVNVLMGGKHFLNLHESTFWSLWVKMISKISPLLKFEILGVFVNTLTADDKYPVRDWENLQFRNEMQLS